MSESSISPVIAAENGDPVGYMSADMFGAIGINIFGFDYFTEHTEALGLTNIRFPGGTVSEYGFIVDGRIRLNAGDISLEALQGDRSLFAFDLTHPELISPLALDYDDLNFLERDDVATFSQVLALAVERDTDVSLIIPVERYFIGADFSDEEDRKLAVETAKSDVRIFLERLRSGEFNDGVMPSSITFDIGNEVYGNPIEYAVIAEAMISEIAIQLEGSDINYEVAFQMGRGTPDFDKLLEDGYFTKFFDGSGDAIAGLGGLDPDGALSPEQKQIAIDEMMISILGDTIQHIDAVRHHTLSFNSNRLDGTNETLQERGKILDYWAAAFAEYGISRDDFAYYISAWSTSSADGLGKPYELSAAANTLELFDHFMDLGVDQAAVWGVVGAFRYKDDMSSTIITDRLSDFVSPQAAVLQLMTEHIADSNYLGASYSIDQQVVSYSYETDTALTIFFVAEEMSDEQISLHVDLGIYGDIQSVTTVNLDVEPGSSNGASRLLTTDQLVANGLVTISFDQHDEIVMVNFGKSESQDYLLFQTISEISNGDFAHSPDTQVMRGTDASEELIGLAETDIILGGGGDDMLEGGGERTSVFLGDVGETDFVRTGANNGDFIFGGAGDDRIYGHAGNDLISGDAGDDHLWGGSGFDTFVFTAGHDIVHDFASGVDRLAVDADMLGGVSIEQWLAANSSQHDEGLLIENSQGDTMFLLGIEDAHDILPDIELFATDDHFVF
ncbi:calcium-binding protein [Loktanella sp. S4079]|uniref:calcium-binding protein n=1 Tax=Loktanella sp. S4079 TaxID=579483 RepID=UPI0005F9D86B|nr:calcium-binding protein [Loktanella sp. S4079]KJZ17930.1 hypothetical protein TW80_16475 [Loktanella sp. S4079]